MTVDDILYAPISQPKPAQCYLSGKWFFEIAPLRVDDVVIGSLLPVNPELQAAIDHAIQPWRDNVALQRVRRLLIPYIELEQSYLCPEALIHTAAINAGFDPARTWQRWNDPVTGAVVLEQFA